MGSGFRCWLGCLLTNFTNYRNLVFSPCELFTDYLNLALSSDKGCSPRVVVDAIRNVKCAQLSQMLAIAIRWQFPHFNERKTKLQRLGYL